MPSSEFGRVPVVVVERDADHCLNQYGVSPCTAGIVDSGTALDGSEDTIQLSSGASAADDAYNGMTVRLLTGPGSVQERRILDYEGASGIATLEKNWRADYLFLPGTSGNYASTPDSAAVSITGDIDIRVKARCANWAASGANRFRFVWKRGGTPAYDFYNDGTLGFYNGTTHTATAAHGFAADSDHWVRVTRSAATGVAKFYTSDDGQTWVQLGADVVKAAGPLNDTTDEIKLCFDGTLPFPSGRLYYAEVRNGIDGDVVAKFDPAASASIGDTQVHSSTGEVWTVNQSGGSPAELQGEFPGTTDPTTYSVIDRPNACFNTFHTCQDEDNFSRGTKTFRFCEPLEDMPLDWLADPSVVNVSVTPSRINAGGASQSSSALGTRGTVSVQFKDHPSSDIRFDPYVADRPYKPMERGTLWTKWNARDPYFQNRGLRVRYGYLGEALASMSTHHFVIDSIEGPGSDGMVTLKGMDVLRLADNNKAQAPALSRGELTADLDLVTTSFSVTGATLDEYDSPSGTVRIGDEVITYTGLNENSDGSLTFSGGARGAEGSEADTHDADDQVQRCLRFTEDRAIDIIYDLLTIYAGVDHSLIDTAGWEAESNRWLTSYELSTLITEPEGVAKLIGEICEQVLLFIWWDDREQLIKLQVLRPPTQDPMLLNETAHVIEASQSFKVDPNQRISQLWIYFQPKNPAGDLDDPNNYRRARLRVDSEAQGPNEFGESKVKTIFSRWLRTESQVTDAATRILARYRDSPLIGSIEADAKDRDIWTGDLIQLTSRLLVDATGAEEARQFHVIAAKETVPGHRVRFDLQNFEPRASRQGRYMGDYAPDYLDATEEELAFGAWYSGEDGLMSDGEAGWRYQ